MISNRLGLLKISFTKEIFEHAGEVQWYLNNVYGISVEI